eukprot:TRINITY_DN1736_c0_g1_i1.p1 TRINITY_DN1736_c0_g1~~TRINITY_DN1736_c0_g1_i1.p1  ORF type:complete len:467 (+),score=144.18 TRINITY_DN1736_c0_g1_i1:122-1402(+)
MNFGWIISGVFVLVISSALIQRRIGDEPISAVGIDLGTSYSCVAAFNSTNGEPYVFIDENGFSTMPSLLFFEDSSSKVNVVTGNEAKKLEMEGKEGPIVFDAKRFIGRSMREILSDTNVSLYPFQLESSSLDDEPLISFQLNERTVKYKPEEISSYVLKRLKEVAESQNRIKIDKVVLAVPVEFNDKQKNATRRAAELAGLTVLRMIHEPTAAAMAYGLHSKKGVRGILVYDFGGGTLDVSLLWIQNKVFEVVSTFGDKHLGGEDFNHNMMDYFLKHIEAEMKTENKHLLSDRFFIQQVRNEVERTKIALSEKESVSFFASYDGFKFNKILTREDFNKINSELFKRAMIPVQKVLQKGKTTTEHVDEVVLIGGSSRLLEVRRLLKEMMGDKLNTKVDPDQAVAMGTAIQAGILTDAKGIRVAAVEL